MNRSDQKAIERQAVNANLTDYGKAGLKPSGEPKRGYFRLKDNRVIKLIELSRKNLINETYDAALETIIEKRTDLKNVGKLGLNPDGSAKPGFYLSKSGAVYGLKKLQA